MLQRTTRPGGRMLTPPLSQSEAPAANQTIAAGQTAPAYMAAWLRYFLIVTVLTGVVACTFIWQANDVADIWADTAGLQSRAARLEQENARLMVQLAIKDSPPNIEAEAVRNGITGEMAPHVVVTPIQLVSAPEPQPARLAVLPEQISGLADLFTERGPGRAR